MNKTLLCLFLTFLSGFSFSQLNMSQIGHLDYEALHNAELNDCWGYVDETGIEYALVGTTEGTSVVSLQNPASPVEVFWLAGEHSVWRDLKVYNDVLYVTTEADEGLTIIDLSPLPGSASLPVSYYFGEIGSVWTSAHNIYIDTAGGWAYICGSDRGNGGIIFLDIHSDPLHPVEVAAFDNWYCHDAFAQGDLLYGAHISDGFFSVIDVSDHTNPQLINTQSTPYNFSHNIWVTSDDHYAVTTDEIAGAYLGVYDVSDPNDIRETDRIRSSPGMNIIPHNAFILHDTLLITSYYTDGVVIHDLGRPNNLVEVGHFDTHPLQNGTFNGCWGVYPYLPSGLIIATDISEGLFILGQNVPRACYFEGLVRDASNLNPLGGVTVTIAGDPQTDITANDGYYAVGKVVPSTVDVTFYKVAYYPQTISVPFATGVVLTDTIDLVPIPPFSLDVIVQEAGTGNPVIGADVRITVPEMLQEGTTNGLGQRHFDLYYPGASRVTVGKWGYITECAEYTLDEATGSITVELEKGIYDDFSFDFGWTAVAQATTTTGFWVRGIPNPVNDNASPAADAYYDCERYAYVTGNADYYTSSDYDDVDHGYVWLRSPVFDLTGYNDPHLYYQRWFFCNYGPGLVDDTLFVFLSNGITTICLDTAVSAGFFVDWVPMSFRVADYITPTQDMQIVFRTGDFDPNPNVTEAGVDVFMITEQPVIGMEEQPEAGWRIFPNPSRETVTVETVVEQDYLLLAPDGSVAGKGRFNEGKNMLDIQHLASGIYVLRTGTRVARIVKM